MDLQGENNGRFKTLSISPEKLTAVLSFTLIAVILVIIGFAITRIKSDRASSNETPATSLDTLNLSEVPNDIPDYQKDDSKDVQGVSASFGPSAPTATLKPSPTSTPIPSPTPSPTQTPTPTSTTSPDPTATPTPEPTVTPTPEPTVTLTPTPTPTPTLTPIPTGP